MFEDLKNIIEGDITTADADRVRYSRDASIFQVKPEAVIYPKNTLDIKKLVNWVRDNKAQNPTLSLTPRAAGTDMSGGPLNDSLILDFTKYFKHFEVREDSAIVEPGVFYRDFEKEASKQGFIFPSYPASKSLCAWGGIIANNSGGEKTLAYGKTDKYVEEVSVVLRDGNEYSFGPLSEQELNNKIAQEDFEGEIYKSIRGLISSQKDLIQSAKPNVHKNSAGYALWNIWEGGIFNLAKLFVGSQGTLGIITKAKVKLVPQKKYSRMLVIFLNDLKNLGRVVNSVLNFKPESFESYDHHTFKLAIKFLPGLIRKMKGNFLSLMFSFWPEIKMAMTKGIPQMVLIAEFTGDDLGQINKIISETQEVLEKEFNLFSHVTRTEKESEKFWVMRRESFNLLRQHAHGAHTAPFIDDIIVRPEFLPEFLPQLESILNQYNIVYTIAGHVGEGNFHIIPLMDFRKKDVAQVISELSEKVYDLVIKYRGSITAEHNDGLIRTPYLEKMYGPEVCKLFSQVKEIFDPQNIFNPRKKVAVPGQKVEIGYFASHLIKE